jgi:hypothetical protein
MTNEDRARFKLWFCSVELVYDSLQGRVVFVDDYEVLMLDAWMTATRIEREACAKLCEVEHGVYGLAPAQDIRARGML